MIWFEKTTEVKNTEVTLYASRIKYTVTAVGRCEKLTRLDDLIEHEKHEVIL